MKDKPTTRKKKQQAKSPEGQDGARQVSLPLAEDPDKGRSGEGAQSAMKQWLLQERKRTRREQ